MKKRIFTLTFVALMLALPTAAFANGPPDGRPVGPPHGNFYANDETYRTVVTPTALPDSAPDHTFDTLYMFPDCGSCSPVSDAAPGDTDYNGGRWTVVLAHGITEQLTNSDDVEAMASDLETTDTRFVCPLIKKM